MYNVSAKPHFLGEKKRINEIRMFAEMFLKEISEALAPSDVRNIINTYMAKIKDPTSQKDFLMQTAFFLGRKASMSPEELDVALRQHFAKNYDPAKLARGQTPTQGAQAQAQKQPPPLPQQKPDFGKLGKPSGNLPSLKNLAGQETQPFWKKQGLPPPESLGQEPKSGKVDKSPEKDEKEDDLPTAKPSDVKSLPPKKKKEQEPKKAASTAAPEDSEDVDMDKFGDKSPEKPQKSEKGKKKEKPMKFDAGSSSDSASSQDKPVPMPSFGSIVKPKLAPGSKLGDPKWKVGQTVDIDNADGGYKVKNKTGAWYNLEKAGDKFVFIPFKGLRKVRF